MPSLQKLTPCLWFDGQAEEAATFYTEIFPDSKIVDISRYTDEGQEIHGQPAGSVMAVAFELAGQRFSGLNGGPDFKFSEAISFQIECGSQEEVDHYWERLGEGGDEEAKQCGWLKDRYGLSWQVVPAVLFELLQDSDTEKVKRVTAVMLRMKKLDIAELQRAYEG